MTNYSKGKCNSAHIGWMAFCCPLLPTHFFDSTAHCRKETVSFSIFFKEDEFTSVTNMHSLRAFDYIANCGGLLSLFLGGSLLSFFEVLYYLSLRLGCSAHRRLRTKPTANADSICRTVCSRCCTSFTYISSTLLFLFSLCFGYILLRMIMGNNQYDSRHWTTNDCSEILFFLISMY